MMSNSEFFTLNGTAPVYPGQANYWVVYLRRPPASVDLQAVADFMRRSVSFSCPELRLLDVWPAGGIPRGKRRALVQPQPFAWPEGSFASITWDATDSSPSKVEWPWDADQWDNPREGLVAVFAPGQIVHVPGPLDNAIHTGELTVGQLGDEVKSTLTTALVWTAVGGAALFALLRGVR